MRFWPEWARYKAFTWHKKKQINSTTQTGEMFERLSGNVNSVPLFSLSGKTEFRCLYQINK